MDYYNVPKDEKFILTDIQGAGCIKHIWITLGCEDKWHMRNVLIKMYWDGEGDDMIFLDGEETFQHNRLWYRGLL